MLLTLLNTTFRIPQSTLNFVYNLVIICSNIRPAGYLNKTSYSKLETVWLKSRWTKQLPDEASTPGSLHLISQMFHWLINKKALEIKAWNIFIACFSYMQFVGSDNCLDICMFGYINVCGFG